MASAPVEGLRETFRMSYIKSLEWLAAVKMFQRVMDVECFIPSSVLVPWWMLHQSRRLTVTCTTNGWNNGLGVSSCQKCFWFQLQICKWGEARFFLKNRSFRWVQLHNKSIHYCGSHHEGLWWVVCFPLKLLERHDIWCEQLIIWVLVQNPSACSSLSSCLMLLCCCGSQKPNVIPSNLFSNLTFSVWWNDVQPAAGAATTTITEAFAFPSIMIRETKNSLMQHTRRAKYQ